MPRRPHVLAAVDLGSNSFHMVVAGLQGVGSFLIAAGGEAAAEEVEISDGNRQKLDPGAIFASGIVAGVSSEVGAAAWVQNGANAAIQTGRAFVVGAASATASYAIRYGIDRLAGQDVHFNWRDMSVEALSSGIAAGVLEGVSPRTSAVGQATNAVNATSTAFRWTDIAREAVESVARQAVHYAVQKTITGHSSWNWQDVLMTTAQDVAVESIAGFVNSGRAMAAGSAYANSAFNVNNYDWSGAQSFESANGMLPFSDSANLFDFGGVAAAGFATGTGTLMPRADYYDDDGTPDYNRYIVAPEGETPANVVWGIGRTTMPQNAPSIDMDAKTQVEAAAAWLGWGNYQGMTGQARDPDSIHQTQSAYNSVFERVLANHWAYNAEDAEYLTGVVNYMIAANHWPVANSDVLPVVPVDLPAVTATINRTVSPESSNDDSVLTDVEFGAGTAVGIVGGAVYSVASGFYGLGKLALNAAGSVVHAVSFGYLANRQYEDFGESVGGIVQLASHPLDTVSKGVGGWYAKTTEALNKGQGLKYGFQIGSGVTNVALMVEGGAGVARKLTQVGGEVALQGTVRASEVLHPVPLEGAAGGAGVAGSAARIPENPTVYSVAFEMKLNPVDFGKSRSVHFNRANAALDSALQSDAGFATMMDELIPDVQQSVSGVGGRATPAGWTWEHASTSTAFGQQGVMRLVPTVQHTPGSPWWRIIHPDAGAAGGYSEWAIPAGAPKN